MLKKIRKYHSIHRFFAMTLFAASILSFIGHACMMDEAHAGPTVKKCCCKKAHNGHDGLEKLPGPACDHKETSHNNHTDTSHGNHLDDYHTSDDDAGVHDDCCSTDVLSFTPDAVKTSKAQAAPIKAQIAFASQFVLSPRNQPAGQFFNLEPPPESSPPFRVLYAQFLN